MNMAEGGGPLPPGRQPPEAAVSNEQPAGSGGVRAWWNNVTKAVLTVGALASAVAAVVALLPSSSPDSEDSARFTTVRVTPEVPLGEYRQRTAALVPEGGDEAGLGRAAVPDVPMQPIGRRSSRPGSQPPETEPGGSPGTSTPGDPQDTVPPPTPPDGTLDGTSDDTSVDGSSSTDTSLDPTSTGSTGSTESTDTSADAPPADASDSTVVLSTPALERAELDLRDYSDEVIEIVGEDVGCPAPGGSATAADDDSSCDRKARTLLPIVLAHATDVDGDPLPPAEAAERVVQLLRSTRVEAGDPGEPGSVAGGGGTAPEPLGVVVTADLELGGLRGEPVTLSWSMWRQGDGGRLYGDWLNENVAYRLEATTDRDTTSVDLWIPLPPEPGPYTVRVQLTRDGSRLASASTDPFT